jgi:hypothetical protein
VKAYTPQRMSQIALLASTQCLGPATHACTSAGTMEDWRPDISGVEEACIGNRLPDWPKERYWDVRCPSVREALTKVSHEETAMSRGHTLRCLACSAATEHAGHHIKEFPVPTDRARLYHMCVPLHCTYARCKVISVRNGVVAYQGSFMEVPLSLPVTKLHLLPVPAAAADQALLRQGLRWH